MGGTVSDSKYFQRRPSIRVGYFPRTGLQHVSAKLAGERHLVGLDTDKFVDRAAFFIGELNAAHPFREGSGRTRREFICELGLKAGH
jgi:fido (protein-threonine AMPylation protein)